MGLFLFSPFDDNTILSAHYNRSAYLGVLV